jgi:hypothetical protein
MAWVFRQIVVLPGIVFEIVKLEQVLAVIIYELPFTVAIHRGMCLIRMIDGTEELRPDMFTMHVKRRLPFHQGHQRFSLHIKRDLHPQRFV